ncbi:hypothetical protein VTI74DRAFT_2943 [Chaetomium olivicolor]
MVVEEWDGTECEEEEGEKVGEEKAKQVDAKVVVVAGPENKSGSWLHKKCKSGWKKLSSHHPWTSSDDTREPLSGAELQTLLEREARWQKRKEEIWGLFWYSLSNLANIYGPVGDLRQWDESYFR